MIDDVIGDGDWWWVGMRMACVRGSDPGVAGVGAAAGGGRWESDVVRGTTCLYVSDHGASESVQKAKET